MKHVKQLILCLLVMSMLCGCASKEAEPIDDKYRTYYEVFVRSFYDGNGDGIGDLQGLTKKLDYIEDMGFNGIWLMPIMSSTTYHKYDVTDYYNIDDEYGTIEDFQAFIKECDERGIDVILDLVFNHTSSEHPWFKTACDYLRSLPEGAEPDSGECPYVDYYHFHKGMKGGDSVVSGTDWYYESIFWYGMPDLNLYNEQVRREVEAVSDYWMNMGVDGFRLDAVKEFESGNDAENVKILSWYVEYMANKYPDAYLVAEILDSLECVEKYYASGIDSVFNYPFGNNNGYLVKYVKNAGDGESGAKFAKVLETVEARYKALNPNMIDAPFLSNHDTGRIAGFLAPEEDTIKFGGALNLMMSGSAFVYYGEEIGMKGSGQDENKRAPMRFSETDTEGMTNPPPNMGKVKQKFDYLDVQQKSKDSINSYYKEAIRIRNTYPEIARGSQKAVELTDGDLIVIAKEYNGQTTYVVANNSSEAKEISLVGTVLEGLKLEDYLVTVPSMQKKQVSLKQDTLKIPGFGVCIIK